MGMAWRQSNVLETPTKWFYTIDLIHTNRNNYNSLPYNTGMN